MKRSLVGAALIGVVGAPGFGELARAQTAATPAPAQTAGKAEPAAATPLSQVPLAPSVKGSRPRVNPALVTPAATTLQPALKDLAAPPSLALPVKTDQVRIQQFRPIGLPEALNLAEVNNPNLKALASQAEQAQSNLRAQIALWYPSINLNANSLPSYTGGQQFSLQGFSGSGGTQLTDGLTSTSLWRMTAALEASWGLINPTRTPQIAAARDEFEKAKNQYLIGLRDLRLQVAQAYFDLQQSDDGVRIGQESVRASLVSLRDAKARYQAGVDTKLAVLQAETQLARDQQVLSDFLASQEVARRTLAAFLDLPQTVTPTAKDPSGVVGVWQASLQDSIVAAYAFREELDQALLDISIANSNANTQLGAVQPFLNIVNSLNAGRNTGYFNADVGTGPFQTTTDNYGWNVDNTIGLNLSWRLFDGGAARARYRQGKQRAQENTFRFAQARDAIRQQVESSFYELEKNNRNITTTAREVISARESLRLARLRFQAGVTTQREVVDTQRDLTQAEVRHSNAINNYNKRLVEIQRRTGLDQIAVCKAPSLPSEKPVITSGVPVEPSPLIPGCQAAR